MRAVALIALLGACAFDGAPLPGASPDSPRPVDAADPIDGGSPDGQPDAPPDAACPDGDNDQDGVCNGVDDWPCGAKPPDPGDPMSDANGGRSWGASVILIGDNRRLVTTPGAAIGFSFGYSVKVDCPGSQSNRCRAQLEIGFDTTRRGCLFDNDVFDDITFRSVAVSSIAAPALPGVYELKLNAGVRSSCGNSQDWFGAPPGADSTIAIVCVPP
ncbi:MAG: hypothetical protein ACTHU0_10755 [Kofleriaceae bacterium]